MNHIDLFSGIGGFALAAQTIWGEEYNNLLFCDYDKFCQNTIRKNFPGSTIFGDIREVTADSASDRWARRGQAVATEEGHEEKSRHNRQLAGRSQGLYSVDLLTGGFPCQPFSAAGQRRGTADDRYLWPEMLRVIQEFSPRWIIGENVGGLVTWSDGLVLRQVLTDLEGEGYEVQAFIIPAAAVNAPHRRDRIWIVAHAQNDNGRGLREISGKNGEKHKPEEQYKDEARQFSHANRNDTNASNEGLERSSQNSEGYGRQSDRKRKNETSRFPTPQDPFSQRTHRGSENRRQILGSGESEVQNAGSGWPDWSRDWREVAFETCVHRVDDGLPKRMARLPDGTTITESKWRQEALKGYGNAIVPQVAMKIMQGIKSLSQ